MNKSSFLDYFSIWYKNRLEVQSDFLTEYFKRQELTVRETLRLTVEQLFTVVLKNPFG